MSKQEKCISLPIIFVAVVDMMSKLSILSFKAWRGDDRKRERKECGNVNYSMMCNDNPIIKCNTKLLCLHLFPRDTLNTI